MITTMLRRLSAVPALALTALVSFGAAGDSVGDVTYPGWKSVASTNWNVNTSAIKNWRSMLDRWADGKDCESDTCTTKGWASMVEQVKAAGDRMAQVKLANALINDPVQHPYIEDINNWAQQEYWETPYQFLKKSGDTEDYAITKYLLLRASGVPAADMQIVAGRIKSMGNIGHAILIVRVDDAHTVVLDNRIVPVLDAKLVKDEFKPMLGLNEDKWSVYVAAQ
jgi:predicted transglutaminase-like cysteine proteinase